MSNQWLSTLIPSCGRTLVREPEPAYPIACIVMLPVRGVCAFVALGDGLRQVHLAAEDGIVFDGQAQGADIALEVAPGTQFHAAAGHHVALHMAHDQHVFGSRSAATLALGPMVSRLSARLTVPSTRPSTIRSSLPFTSPQITIVLPIRAEALSTAMISILPWGLGYRIPRDVPSHRNCLEALPELYAKRPCCFNSSCVQSERSCFAPGKALPASEARPDVPAANLRKPSRLN